MSKKITIIGKNNIDKLNKNKKSIRQVVDKWSNSGNLLNEKKDNQITMLNQLFLKENFEGYKFVKKEVERKINGYKNQDIKKKIYDKNKIITYDETLEKLVISKLKCYYCRKQCLLMYSNVRDNTQWTLDRIDNKIGHHKNNTVVCCLKCNLKKGTMDDEKFKFTKQLRIIKKY